MLKKNTISFIIITIPLYFLANKIIAILFSILPLLPLTPSPIPKSKHTPCKCFFFMNYFFLCSDKTLTNTKEQFASLPYPKLNFSDEEYLASSILIKQHPTGKHSRTNSTSSKNLFFFFNSLALVIIYFFNIFNV